MRGQGLCLFIKGEMLKLAFIIVTAIACLGLYLSESQGPLQGQGATIGLAQLRGAGGGGGVSCPSDQLLAHWTFDDGEGVVATDSSGNGFDGDLINAVTWAEGKLGQSVLIDAADEAVHINPFSFGEAPQVSFAYWYYPIQFSHGASTIINDGSQQSASVPHLWHYFDQGSDIWFSHVGEWVLTVSLDTWRFMIVTIDFSANELTLYHDNVVDASVKTPGSTGPYNRNELFFGKYGPGVSWTMRGRLDDFRIYTKVLTEEERGLLWNDGAGCG